MTTIHREIDTLTDGSIAFNIVLRDGDQRIRIPVAGELAADRLQHELLRLIDGYTVDTVDIGDDLSAFAGRAA